MIGLQITEAKAKKMNEVEDLALDTIRDALKGNTPADAPKVKVASASLSTIGKNRQTTTHSRAIEFTMATSIATEPELKKYMKATNPEIMKALGGKS